jgi:sodium transport system permease protein
MSLNLSTIKTLFRAELRMVLRDRRMLVTSVLLPLLVTPLMLLGSSWSLKKRERTLQEMTCKYAVAGPQAEKVRALVSTTRQRLAAEKTRDEKQAPFKFEEVTCEDTLAALNKGDVHLVIEGLLAEETGSRTNVSASPNEGGETPVAGAPIVRLVSRGDRDESSTASARMYEALAETRRAQRADLLKAHQFSLNTADVMTVTTKDLSSARQVAGLALGRMLTLVLTLFILTGGAVVAIDSLAGEKERGTLETLLTSAASRGEILAAKHLVVLGVALLIVLVQTANLLIWVSFKLLPLPAGLVAAVTPSVVALLFVMFLPVAALAANVLLLISGYARSYKEAQMYFTPAMLVGFLPALAPMLPGLSLRSAIVVVPVANIGLAVKEILSGTFDWPMILLSWLITAGAAAWTARLGVRFLSAEKLITATERDAVEFTGGPALFERRVPRWFALLWAALLLVSNYTSALDVRLQAAINLAGLFFGASLLMMWRYQLSPREALALRAPKAWAWLGVLVAVPGGMLVALGLFQLTNLVLPVSSRMTEAFSESIFPKDASTAQLMFFLAIMPAVFEEIAFRGLLLHGLRRRLSPPVLAVVVGLTFGIFHVALFRFAPTAALGIMLASVTLLTGSIYPAMLWHCLNNTLGLLASRWEISESSLGLECYAIGAGLLAVAFWIFWRNRTPYPGLRSH